MRDVTDLLLRSIRLFPPSCEWELIVSVQRTGTLEDMAFDAFVKDIIFDAKIVWNNIDHVPSKGNAAARAAKGEYLMFMTADALASPDFFDHFLAWLFEFEKIAKVGMVGCWTTGLRGLWQDCSITPYGGPPTQVNIVFGTAFMVRKSVWDEVGGLDEASPTDAGTDDDISFRLWNLGYHHFLIPEVVLHFGRMSYKSRFDCDGNIKICEDYLKKKHGENWRNEWKAKVTSEMEHFKTEVERRRTINSAMDAAKS